MYLILSCCAPFLHNARPPDCKIFMPVMVGSGRVLLGAACPDPSCAWLLVQECWAWWGAIYCSSPEKRHLNVCEALDVFWCRWRFTDARGAVRYCKNAFLCPACLKSVLGRDVSFTALLRNLSTCSVMVFAWFLCKRARRAEVWNCLGKKKAVFLEC